MGSRVLCRWTWGVLTLWLAGALGCAALLGEAALSEKDVSRAATHRDRGSLKLREGQVELAIREYQRSIELNPYDAEAHFGFGEALRLKGRLDEAQAQFLRALRLQPQHHDARINLTVVHLEREEWDRAIAESDRLLDDPTFLNPARAYVNRGWARFSAGDAAGAEADFREALQVDSAIYQAHLNLGIVLYARGEIPESLQSFQRVVDILERYGAQAPSGAEAEVRFRIAQARVKLGQREEAVTELRRAVERGGGSRWEAKAREYLSVLE